MIPHQASLPLRRMLMPCIRLYTQHCASVYINFRQTGHRSFSSVPILDNQIISLNHITDHLGRSFSTSWSPCEIASEHVKEAEKTPLQFQNGQKASEISKASFEQIKHLALTAENAYFACLILQRLSALYKEGNTLTNAESLLQESWLDRVLQLVNQNVMKISPKLVMTTLQSLYEMTATDIFLVKTLMIQVQWLLRRLPVPLLIQVVQLHLSHQETPTRVSILQQSIASLERRWVELTNPKDIVLLMYTLCSRDASSQSLEERLEDRALDVIEKMGAKELYRILYLLSRHRHRNTPLIRAVVYHLNKLSPCSSLSTVQLTNLVYALATLTVYDAPLLSKVSQELCRRGDDLTPKLVASLVESFSRLRWREGSVFHLLLSRASQTLGPAADSRAGQGLSTADKVGLAQSLANLSMDGSHSKALMAQLTTSPEVRALKLTAPVAWLDVVWSLAVLQMLDAASAASVLKDDFWGNMTAPDNFQSLVNLAKLNNINMAAKLEVKDYEGPFLPPSITTCDTKLLLKGERKVAEKVVGALVNMAPLDSYTRTNVTTPGGYLIDAEFFVNDNGEPTSLAQVKQNPIGFHRLALKVLDFPDVTLTTSDPTGLHVMAARHLQRQSYILVQVLHTEVSSKTKVVELIQLLQEKIKGALSARVKDGTKVSQPGS